MAIPKKKSEDILRGAETSEEIPESTCTGISEGTLGGIYDEVPEGIPEKNLKKNLQEVLGRIPEGSWMNLRKNSWGIPRKNSWSSL